MLLQVVEARDLSMRALAALGFNDADAAITTDHLLDAALRGVTYGGLPRILTIAERVAQFVDRRTPIAIERETDISAAIDGGDNVGMHTWDGETQIKYTGPKPPFETLEGFSKYSFLKTPRWKDNAMEVGPLARLLVSFASGHTDVQELVKDTLGKLNVPVDALFSTLVRTAARGLDAALAMIWLKEFFGELMDRVKINEVSTFNGDKW